MCTLPDVMVKRNDTHSSSTFCRAKARREAARKGGVRARAEGRVLAEVRCRRVPLQQAVERGTEQPHARGELR